MVPTNLTLYNRNPKIHSNYNYARYGELAEDMVHVISCMENEDTLEEVIKTAIKIIYKKTQPSEEQQRKFIKKYHKKHIQKKIPIRFISEATMGWEDPQSEKQTVPPEDKRNYQYSEKELNIRKWHTEFIKNNR
ncbi:23641_t:CDS:2, partial [Gigaspora margarita]